VRRIAMTYEWEQQGTDYRQPAEGSPEPDTETLLAELAAFYPVVSYPAAEELDPEAAADEAIFAGLVHP
jgi:hypothetical protein